MHYVDDWALWEHMHFDDVFFVCYSLNVNHAQSVNNLLPVPQLNSMPICQKIYNQYYLCEFWSEKLRSVLKINLCKIIFWANLNTQQHVIEQKHTRL